MSVYRAAPDLAVRVVDRPPLLERLWAALFDGRRWAWWRARQGGRWARVWRRNYSWESWAGPTWESVPECPLTLYGRVEVATGYFQRNHYLRGECTPECCTCEVYGPEGVR